MGFYGNKWLTENAQTNNSMEAIATLESVVYNEYCNYKSLLENASGSDVAILEAKVEVLYEVSIADIKQKIKDAIKKFLDFIKKIKDKLKDLFTGAKYKVMQKQYSDLEKKLKEAEFTNAELNKELESLRKRSESEKAEAEKERDAANSALQRLVKTADKIIDNPILYFDAFDYFVKDVNPVKLARCDFVPDMKDVSKDNTAEYIERWVNTNGKLANVLKPEIQEKVGEMYTTNDARLKDIIRENLYHLKETKPFTDWSKLMDQLEYLAGGFQASGLNETIHKYEQACTELERALLKIFDYDEDKRGEDGEKNKPISLQVQLVQESLKILNTNIKAMYLLSSFASRAAGAASQAIFALEAIMDNYKKRY